MCGCVSMSGRLCACKKESVYKLDFGECTCTLPNTHLFPFLFPSFNVYILYFTLKSSLHYRHYYNYC